MHSFRPFTSEAEIRAIGRGLLDHSLPLDAWTHEAHLAAYLWLLVECPHIDAERELRAIIGSYNEARGGTNSDTAGYHHMITLCFLAGIRDWLSRCPDHGLLERVNGLLASEAGQREWPLRFFSRDRLFSVEARRGWVEPDRKSLPRSEH